MNDHRHMLFFICKDMRDSLEVLPIYADVENIVIRQPHWRYLLHIVVRTEVGSEDISIELNWIVTHGHPNSFALLFRSKTFLMASFMPATLSAAGIPGGETSPAIVPEKDSYCPEGLLKCFFFQGQSVSWFLSPWLRRTEFSLLLLSLVPVWAGWYCLWNGGNTFAHSVFLVLFWCFSFHHPVDWHCWAVVCWYSLSRF